MKRISIIITCLLIAVNVFAQPCTPAANPFCFAPINLTVGGACVNGTTCQSMGFVQSSCNTIDNQSAWYTFVATVTSMTVDIDLINSTGCDFSSTVYSGVCVSGITELSCLSGSPSDDIHFLTNLSVGNTYSIQISYSSGGTCGTDGFADFCISANENIITNDEPCTATLLPVDINCVFQIGTNDGATDTPGVVAPGCGNYLGSDVWFTAIVPTNGSIDIEFNNGVMEDGGAAIYTGPNCDSLTLLQCDNDGGGINGLMPNFSLFGLTPGSAIWIRVWEFDNDNIGDFEICATIGTPPVGCTVTNLSCALATPIVVDDPCIQGSTCNGGSPTLTSCNATMTEGTWFTFVATDPEMNVYINHVSNTGCYYASSVFSGSCGSLTELSCESDAPLNDAHVLLGLTIGVTYYIQVSYPPGGPCGNNGYSEFCISVVESPCQGGSNNSCITAEPFCTGTAYSYCNTTGIPSAGMYSCLGSTPNPMWMYLQIDNPGPIDIQISQFDNFGGTLDVDFAMYGPYVSVADACNNITPGSPTVDCSYLTAAVETANFTGGAAGEFYILLVTNYSNNPGYINFSQIGGNGSFLCQNCTIEPKITVFNDITNNCSQDVGEFGVEGVNLYIEPGNIVTTTNAIGQAFFGSLPNGNYTVTIDTTNLNWSTNCGTIQSFEIVNGGTGCFELELGLINNNPCTDPDVSIFAPSLRRCFSDRIIYVSACNQVTATGILDSSYVDVELDPLLTVDGASLPYTDLGNNTFRFETGDIYPGQCVNFTLSTTVSCDAQNGQTLCMDATLYPAEDCIFDSIPSDPITNDGIGGTLDGLPGPCTLPWDKSSLQVDGWCQGDSVYFSVTNTGDFGDGDMECYSPVWLTVDGVVTDTDSLQIQGGETVIYSYPASGQTFFLNAEQHPLHPGNSHPNAHVELVWRFNQLDTRSCQSIPTG